jgi:two-component system response regulator HydG
MEEEARIDDKLDGFVGASQAMKAVAERIALVAPTNTTVLVLGETGCGKELAARALHRMSRRAGGPFVAVNCAAFCESLVESELFGHERGAFTGAVAMKKGLIECANGGTLFLDEAGDLSVANQAKLLRVLQERVVERLGSTSRAKPVDIRLIAATNRDLRAAVDEGRMRLDFYYRLNAFRIELPPLRNRREDIPALAHHFVAKYAAEMRRSIRGVSADAVSRLQTLDWPGNVRELEHAIESAVVVCKSDFILPEDLPADLFPAEPGNAAFRPVSFFEGTYEYQSRLIQKTLDYTKGERNEAARLLHLHPKTLHRKIRELRLDGSL